jgi:hypothetical protein
MERILSRRHAELAAFFVEDGDAHAQRAEVDSCHYTHGSAPWALDSHAAFAF